MILNKLFHFWKGYVIIKISGHGTERFISMAAKKGLRLWDISKPQEDGVSLSLGISDFFRLPGIVAKCGVRVRVLKKAGLPITFKKIRKRYFFIPCAVLFLVFTVLSSQFIWSVEIDGVKNADAEKIVSTLKDSGIYVGAPRFRIKKIGEIKNTLLNRVDNITWAWIYLKGTKAVCKIYEDTLPPTHHKEGEPCDIVAARDGIIKRITVTGGVKIRRPGDTVCAGDILVSGMVLDKEGMILGTVESTGEIEARTWHEKKGTYKLYYETKRPTGRKKSFWKLRFFAKDIPLYFSEETDFEETVEEEKIHEARIFGEHYLGISLIERRVIEVTSERVPISYDMAVYGGKCELEKQIASELLPGSELVSENLSHRLIDSETAEVVLTMEFIEKIGQSAPIEYTNDFKE